MIRAMVFDVDGVLIAPWRFRALLASEHGIGPQDTAGFFNGPFVQCVLGRLDLRDALPAYLERWHWPGSLEEFLATWFEADGAVDQRMLAAVRQLREAGLLACVASTQERLRAAHITRELGFGAVFDGLYFSCDLGVMKPNPDFFTAIAKAIAIPPHEIVFFDDSQRNVLAAREAGWNAELFADHASFQPHLRRLLAR